MVSCPTQSNHWYGEGNNKVSIKSPDKREFSILPNEWGSSKTVGASMINEWSDKICYLLSLPISTMWYKSSIAEIHES